MTYFSTIEEKWLLKSSAIILKSVTYLLSWAILLIDLSDVYFLPSSLNKETSLRGSYLCMIQHVPCNISIYFSSA